MNKRMRKLLVSLGLVVVLGTGNTFANPTTPDVKTASGLKQIIDPADDYAVFARIANIGGSHFVGTIAAETANLGTKIGLTKDAFDASNNDIRNVSYIENLGTSCDFPVETSFKSTWVLNTTTHTLESYASNKGWKVTREVNGTSTTTNLVNEDDQLEIKSITSKGLQTSTTDTTSLDVTTVLSNLETASEELGAMQNSTTQFEVVNINGNKLQTGIDYNVPILDKDNDNIYGITIINVTVRTEDIEADGYYHIKNQINALKGTSTITGGWQPESRKILFNFLDQDGNAFTGKIKTDKLFMGTILAPKATVKLNGGNYNGAVICDTFEGNECEVHQMDLNIQDKNDDNPTGGGGITDEFDQWTNDGEDAGDALLIAPLGVAAVGAAVVFFANRKDDDDE